MMPIGSSAIAQRRDPIIFSASTSIPQIARDGQIRVCIGTEPRTLIPCRVLQYSILTNRRTHLPIQFHELEGGDWSYQGPLLEYTGFSLLRWTIPDRFNYQGKAIYLDADELVLGDIADLWRADVIYPNAHACLWCTQGLARRRLKHLPFIKWRALQFQTSVMLIDCKKARGQVMPLGAIAAYLAANPSRAKLSKTLRTQVRTAAKVIDSRWNVMDGGGRNIYSFTNPKLVHFTEVRTQPWYYPDHPARDLWETYLIGALEAGFVDKADIRYACTRYSIGKGRPNGMHPYWTKFA